MVEQNSAFVATYPPTMPALENLPGAFTPCLATLRSLLKLPFSKKQQEHGTVNGRRSAEVAPSGTPSSMTPILICSTSVSATELPGTASLAALTAATIFSFAPSLRSSLIPPNPSFSPTSPSTSPRAKFFFTLPRTVSSTSSIAPPVNYFPQSHIPPSHGPVRST